MLNSNGRVVKQRRNYHMSLAELGQLLRFLRRHYDPKWFVAVMLQFGLGLRASEMLAVQISDFYDRFRWLRYRAAKTNEIREVPVPEPLIALVVAYVFYNAHRMKNGFLFSKYTGCGDRTSTETYGAFWTKWRRAIGRKNPRFLDTYVMDNGQVRHRIGSHSLRRLHRTVLRNEVKDLYIVKELCGYADYGSLERYINDQEIFEKMESILLPIFNPVIKNLVGLGHGQTRIQSFIGSMGMRTESLHHLH